MDGNNRELFTTNANNPDIVRDHLESRKDCKIIMEVRKTGGEGSIIIGGWEYGSDLHIYNRINILLLANNKTLHQLRAMFNHGYNTFPGGGIENIYFKNISYHVDKANLSSINGYDETRQIKKITFEYLRINGKVISDNMPDKLRWYKTVDMANFFIGKHVNGISFIK